MENKPLPMLDMDRPIGDQLLFIAIERKITKRDEIQLAIREIQAGWDAKTERKRRTGSDRRKPIDITIVDTFGMQLESDVW